MINCVNKEHEPLIKHSIDADQLNQIEPKWKNDKQVSLGAL